MSIADILIFCTDSRTLQPGYTAAHGPHQAGVST